MILINSNWSDKDIIMHAKNPELTFEYYYTYVIGSVRHQSETLSIIRKFLMYVHWKQTQTPHIDRYLLVESIRTIIGHCTCSQFNESINVLRKLKKILTDHC